MSRFIRLMIAIVVLACSVEARADLIDSKVIVYDFYERTLSPGQQSLAQFSPHWPAYVGNAQLKASLHELLGADYSAEEVDVVLGVINTAASVDHNDDLKQKLADQLADWPQYLRDQLISVVGAGDAWTRLVLAGLINYPVVRQASDDISAESAARIAFRWANLREVIWDDEVERHHIPQLLELAYKHSADHLMINHYRQPLRSPLNETFSVTGLEWISLPPSRYESDKQQHQKVLTEEARPQHVAGFVDAQNQAEDQVCTLPFFGQWTGQVLNIYIEPLAAQRETTLSAEVGSTGYASLLSDAGTASAMAKTRAELFATQGKVLTATLSEDLSVNLLYTDAMFHGCEDMALKKAAVRRLDIYTASHQTSLLILPILSSGERQWVAQLGFIDQFKRGRELDCPYIEEHFMPLYASSAGGDHRATGHVALPHTFNATQFRIYKDENGLNWKPAHLTSLSLLSSSVPDSFDALAHYAGFNGRQFTYENLRFENYAYTPVRDLNQLIGQILNH
ncbi:MAG: hypothetical protein Tsb002_36030 [Wenzhouxiangellaceae bacterium]